MSDHITSLPRIFQWLPTPPEEESKSVVSHFTPKVRFFTRALKALLELAPFFISLTSLPSPSRHLAPLTLFLAVLWTHRAHSHLRVCLKHWLSYLIQFSSVAQSCLTLWSHGSQHTRPPCPSPTPGVYSDSCLLSRWCHPTISSSVVPFSSCLQSFLASGLFKWVSSSHQVAKVLDLQYQPFQWIFRTDLL